MTRGIGQIDVERTMIAFFDGLIPEGWLLDIAIDNWKLDRRDRMRPVLQDRIPGLKTNV